MTCMLAQASTRRTSRRRNLALRLGRQIMLEADRRIVVEDAATALAKHHLVAMPQVLKELRAQYHVTGRAASIGGLSHGHAAPFLSDALVSRVGLRFLPADQGLALA